MIKPRAIPRKGNCINWTGLVDVLHHKKCLAGIDYRDVSLAPGLRPCSPNAKGQREGVCLHYEAVTDEDAEAYQAMEELALLHAHECMSRELSPCCEAPIDSSQAIKAGPYKGHGPHICSKCRKLAYWV